MLLSTEDLKLLLHLLKKLKKELAGKKYRSKVKEVITILEEMLD